MQLLGFNLASVALQQHGHDSAGAASHVAGYTTAWAWACKAAALLLQRAVQKAAAPSHQASCSPGSSTQPGGCSPGRPHQRAIGARSC